MVLESGELVNYNTSALMFIGQFRAGPAFHPRGIVAWPFDWSGIRLHAGVASNPFIWNLGFVIWNFLYARLHKLRGMRPAYGVGFSTPFSSRRRGCGCLGRGAPGASAMVFPYFQSGGQMAI